jgi:hypothetical protein
VNNLFGTGGPSYAAAYQGEVADCWLLASLSAVAARQPAQIESMFTFLGNSMENGAEVGVYRVRFFNKDNLTQAEYVNVDTEFPGGGTAFDNVSDANGVLWVALAEKAYAEASSLGWVTVSNPSVGDSYATLQGAPIGSTVAPGGEPVWALQAVTGQAASSNGVNPANASIASIWQAGYPIVLDSIANHASPLIVGSPTEGTHSYAVVGYNPSSTYAFELFNPWGISTLAGQTAPPPDAGVALGATWSAGLFNGNQVYGLFWASASFLPQNYGEQDCAVPMLALSQPTTIPASTSQDGAEGIDQPAPPLGMNSPTWIGGSHALDSVAVDEVLHTFGRREGSSNDGAPSVPIERSLLESTLKLSFAEFAHLLDGTVLRRP